MTTVNLDAVDAEEIAEILEYFLERIDAPEDNPAVPDLSQRHPYGPNDLRSDLTRLIECLRTSPITP